MHIWKYTKLLLRWILGLASATITGLLIGVIIISAMTMSDQGRVWIAEFGFKMAAEQTGYHVQWQKPHSRSIGHWEIAELVVRYEDTELLRAENLAFHLDVWHLAESLTIHEIKASLLQVHLDALETLPPSTPEPEADPAPFTWPTYPVTLKQLALERLILSHPDIQSGWSDYVLHADVALFAPTAPVVLNADIRTLSGTPLAASIHTTSPENNAWRIEVHASEEAGGFIGALIGHTATDPLTLNLSTLLHHDPATQRWQVTLESLASRYREHAIAATGAFGFHASELIVSALDATYGDASLAAQGTLHFAAPTSELHGTLRAVSFTLLQSLGIAIPEGINGTLDAGFTLAGPLATPQIALKLSSNGTLLKDSFQLELNADGGLSGGRITSAKLTTKRHGKLSVAGKIFPHSFDLSIDANALSSALLKLWQINLPDALLSVKLALKGSMEAPALSGTANYRASPYAIDTTFKTEKSTLHTQLAFARNKQPLGNATLSLPLAPYLTAAADAPFPLAGTLKAEAELSALALVLDPAIHTVQGRIKTDLAFSGNVVSPSITGPITLHSAAYSNRQMGLELGKIQLDLQAKESGIDLRHLTATDGGDGTLSLNGNLNWGTGFSGAGSQVDMTLKTSKLRLIRRHDIDGTATGSATLKGTLAEMALKGKFLISPLTVMLNQMSNHSVPTIDVTEVKTGERRALKTPDSMPIIHVDLGVEVDESSHVEGLGLDTALTGRVNVLGQVPDLDIDGKFRTVKGSYNLFGRKFVLEDGRVEFEDERVLLFVPGTYKSKDTTIRAELAGTMEKMDISLSSVPPMPQEDIISWLLFGKSSSNVSPFQAIRLASAVQELRGGKSMFNPVDSLQKALKLDSISVESDENSDSEDVTIGIGKYISEKVYLEVQKGSNPAQPFKGSVEIELRENLTLETETGGESGAGGVGLKWKRDY